MLSDAFILLAQANNDYRAGRTLDVLHPSPTAREVVGATLTAVPAEVDGTDPPGPTAPTVRKLRRMVEVKTGFLLLLEGRRAEAIEAYDRAAPWASGRLRDEAKVALGRALVEYQAAGGQSPAAAAARRQTEQLAAQVAEAGIVDVATIARHNAVMADGGRTLRPYEIR